MTVMLQNGGFDQKVFSSEMEIFLLRAGGPLYGERLTVKFNDD